MGQIITFSDRKPTGTFAQIKLDDGKRILISFTQTEIAVLTLMWGIIPTGTLFKHDISEFLEFFCVRIEQIGINESFLEAVVKYLLPSKNEGEIIKKLNEVVEGHNDSNIKKSIEEQLRKQVGQLYVEKS